MKTIATPSARKRASVPLHRIVGWRTLNQETPSEGQKCIVRTKGGRMRHAHWHKGWGWVGHGNSWVTYWKPLKPANEKAHLPPDGAGGTEKR